MDALRSFGIENPERHCLEVSDEAVAGVVRWYRHASRQGQRVGGGLIVTKLRNGGLAGYGTDAAPVTAWYRNSAKRWEWLEDNLPDADPFYAEAAILQLVAANREPSVGSVKELAERLEREQEEWDEVCKEGVRV